MKMIKSQIEIDQYNFCDIAVVAVNCDLQTSIWKVTSFVKYSLIRFKVSFVALKRSKRSRNPEDEHLDDFSLAKTNILQLKLLSQ